MDEKGRSDHDHVVDSAAIDLDQAVRDPVVLLVRVSMKLTWMKSIDYLPSS